MSGPEVPKTTPVQYLLPQRDRCGIQQRGTVLESDHMIRLHVFQVCNQPSVIGACSPHAQGKSVCVVGVWRQARTVKVRQKQAAYPAILPFTK